VSRQGQRPAKRSRIDIDGDQPLASMPVLDERNVHGKKNDGLVKSEDSRLIDHVKELGKQHYGVLYLIYSWTSFAFARRSFSLLSRASRLAAKCGVPMDEVFCQRRRGILDPIMLYSKGEQEQQQHGASGDAAPLRWSDLPPSLLKESSITDESSGREARYVMIREAKNGHSRYLLSRAFQRDIASLWLIEQTWKANEKPVVGVFLEGQTDFDKFTKAIGYQVSRYSEPNRMPECVRIKGVRVKMSAGEGNVEEMDMAYAFEIVTLEHSFYVMELVPRHSQEEGLRAESSGANVIEEEHKLQSAEPLDNSLFDNIEDLAIDEDMQAILDQISWVP